MPDIFEVTRIVEGTVRGPLIIAAPMLLGLPAALNVVAAASSGPDEHMMVWGI